MSNELTVVEEKPQGRLSLKHKAAAVAFGGLLIWLGRRIMSINTYEEIEQLGGEAEEKIKQLEEEHGEDMKFLE